MAGKVDRSGPWSPGRKSRELYLDRCDWEILALSQTDKPKIVIMASGVFHEQLAIKISDAAIYRMIMKESEQE